MKKERDEKIKIKSKWFDYEHYNPSNRGMNIIIAVLVATVVIVLICKIA